MDAKIEELVMKANEKRYYQIMLITAGFLIYVTTNVISATYGFFTAEPQVTYLINGVPQPSTQLTEKICKDYPDYNITKEYKNTWYYSFGSYCNNDVNFLAPLIGNFGSLVGFLTLPFEIQYFGEKNTILITGYAYSVVCFVNIFMPSWATAFVFSFLNNVTGTQMEIAFFMSLSENCPGKIRSIALNIIGSGYSVAGFIFVGLFWGLDAWKTPLIISAALNLLLTIAIHIFLYESPRYYLKIGRVDLFVQTLKKVAKFNRCSLTFDPIANKILREYDDEQSQERSGIHVDDVNRSLLEQFKQFALKEEKVTKKYTVIDLLRFGSHRKNFILMNLLGLFSSGVYQALQITLNGLSGNIYLSGIITYAIQLPVAISAGFFMNVSFLKRKGNMYISMGISVVIMLVLRFVPDLTQNTVTVLTVILVNSSYYFSQVYGAYNTEVYSTKLLNTGLTWNASFAVVGSMVLPIINTKVPTEYFIIFSAFLVVAGVFLFFLPETLGRPQPTEIPEEALMEKNEEE